MTSTDKIPGRPVILFDGVCNLCNGFVQFMLKRDRRSRFYYVPLQSKAGHKLLEGRDAEPEKLETIFLLYNNRLYRKSEAILKIARHLGGFYRLMVIFRVIPRLLRDKIYDFIAANRYRWFGRRDTCRMPAEGEASVFFTEALPEDQ